MVDLSIVVEDAILKISMRHSMVDLGIVVDDAIQIVQYSMIDLSISLL